MPLPAGFEAVPQRLLLGIEPREAWRDGRVRHPVRVDIEHAGWRLEDPRAPYRRDQAPGAPQPIISRHHSGRHALLVHPVLDGLPPDQRHVDVRLYDHRRRYVPRRFQVPILTADEADAQEATTRAPASLRTRRPLLFPGANHDVLARATGLRGRVERDGVPMRWARVEAQLQGGAVVGRAHGDDRGEFLLLLESEAAVGALTDPLTVRVVVSGPAVPPVPTTADLPARDPFWDVPLERLPDPVADPQPDSVSAATTPPTGFITSLPATRLVGFALGRISSTETFVFA